MISKMCRKVTNGVISKAQNYSCIKKQMIVFGNVKVCAKLIRTKAGLEAVIYGISFVFKGHHAE